MHNTNFLVESTAGLREVYVDQLNHVTKEDSGESEDNSDEDKAFEDWISTVETSLVLRRRRKRGLDSQGERG